MDSHRAVTAVCLVGMLAACASRDTIDLPNIQVAGTYSSIEFIEEAGDIVGVEINVVPASGDAGYQAAVQIAEGGPGPLVLASVREDLARPCRWISMDLDAPYNARIEGCVEIDAFVGTLISQAGVETPIRAPRRAGYWAR